jgi:hypothetical protein
LVAIERVVRDVHHREVDVPPCVARRRQASAAVSYLPWNLSGLI